MSYNIFKGELLVGKSNYIEWLARANLFFEINGFMPYIDETEEEPNKELYYNIGDKKDTPRTAELAVKYAEKSSKFRRNSAKALGAIKSIISRENIERFKDKETTSELYNAIVDTFGPSSLDTIGRYFNKLVSANYNTYKSMDEYTSAIQSSSIYLKDLGCEIPKPLLINILFKGLPNSFKSLISYKYKEIGKDLNKIDISKLISELIAEEARMSNSIDLEANKASKYYNSNNKTPFCTYCSKKGHIESRCYSKYPELKNKSNRTNSNSNSNSNYKDKNNNNKNKTKEVKNESNKLIMTTLALNSNIYNTTSKYKIVLDSGATEHYTCNKDYLIDYKPISSYKTVQVANGTSIPIKGVGNIPIIVNNTSILITRVNYLPDLNTTLISSKELANKGWSILFQNDNATISHKSLNFNIKANWNYNAYYLNIDIDAKALEPIVYKVDPSIIEYNSETSTPKYNKELNLFHKRLNHINKDYLIKTLNKFTINEYKGKGPIVLPNCESCHMGKFHEKVSYKPLKAPILKLTFFDIDTYGPFKVIGHKGERYFLTIIDCILRAI